MPLRTSRISLVVRRFAVVGVLLFSACAHQADDTTPAPSAPTVVPLTVAQASKGALTVADLPKGWEGGVAPAEWSGNTHHDRPGTVLSAGGQPE